MMHRPAPASWLRRAFTLIEIGIATLVLVVACLIVMRLLPTALLSQQQSRFRMLASAHAQTLVTEFMQHDVQNMRAGDKYGPQSRMQFSDKINNWNFKGGSSQRNFRLKLQEHKMLADRGMYDLERQAASARLKNYPVPLQIARRLQSPGDEIGKILDDGGYIYYSADDVDGSGDMSKLVWAVTGNAQLGVLPYNPVARPYTELYPFPPIARPKPVDRSYRFNTGQSYKWKKFGGPYTIRRGERAPSRGWPYALHDLTVQRYRRVPHAPTKAPFEAVEPQLVYGPNAFISSNKMEMGDEMSSYQRNNWEWYAERHRKGDPEISEKWENSLQEYRNLVHRHWLRIVHQIDVIEINEKGSGGGGGGSSDKPATVKVKYEVKRVPVFKWVPKRDANNQIVRDALGQPVLERKRVGEKVIYMEVDEAAKEGDNTVIVLDGSSGGGGGGDEFVGEVRGYPAPANGVGFGQLRGTDILEEDAAAHCTNLLDQIRVSLPSLERRIRYRSAALALWAKAAYNKDIVDPDNPNLIFVQNIKADGTAGDSPGDTKGKDVLLAEENPLSKDFKLPPVSELHPTMVLAASHLAHAAVMVTGYNHPFYETKNTVTAADDQLMVDPDRLNRRFGAHEDELPYKWREAGGLEYVDAQDQNPGEVQIMLDDGSLVLVEVDPTDGTIDVSGYDQDLEDGDNTLPKLHEDFYNPADPTTNPQGGKLGFFHRRDKRWVASLDNNSRLQLIDPDYNTYLMNPYHEDINEPNTQSNDYTFKTFTRGTKPNDPKLYQFHADRNGALDLTRPILYRRFSEPDVINRYPPPYADKGAISISGERQYGTQWQLVCAAWIPAEDEDGKVLKDPDTGENFDVPAYRLLRKVVSSPEGKDITDSLAARNAHENCLLMSMQFVSENPYDLTVPKPLNRPTFIDRGIYQFDIFAGSSNAVRPTVGRRYATYPITFPLDASRQDIARFGAQWVPPITVDSYEDGFSTRDNRRHRLSKTDFGPRKAGMDNGPFYFGQPSNLPGDNLGGLTYSMQDTWSKWANRAHGNGWKAGNVTRPTNPTRTVATRPFQAEHRARQLVYWNVDWMAYEDFESAPSAPVDASQVNRDFLDVTNDPKVHFWVSHWKKQKHTQKDALGNETTTFSHYLELRTVKNMMSPALEPVFRTGEQLRVVCEAVNVDEVMTVTRQGHNKLRLYTRIRNKPTDNDGKDGTYQRMRRAQADANDANNGNIVADFVTIHYTPKSIVVEGGFNHLIGNPEAAFCWVDPERTAPYKGWDQAKALVDDSAEDGNKSSAYRAYYVGSGHVSLPLSDFTGRNKDPKDNKIATITRDGRDQIAPRVLGAFGADRNRNGVYNQGNVSRTVNMQAAEVARFTFYDPVTWMFLNR